MVGLWGNYQKRRLGGTGTISICPAMIVRSFRDWTSMLVSASDPLSSIPFLVFSHHPTLPNRHGVTLPLITKVGWRLTKCRLFQHKQHLMAQQDPRALPALALVRTQHPENRNKMPLDWVLQEKFRFQLLSLAWQ